MLNAQYPAEIVGAMDTTNLILSIAYEMVRLSWDPRPNVTHNNRAIFDFRFAPALEFRGREGGRFY